MSKGRDVAEGALPQWTVLFEMTAGSTLETPVVIGVARMGRGLSSKGSGSVRVVTTFDRGGWTSDGVGGRLAVSCRRKDGRNHPSESRKIEGRESGALMKWRGYGARTLRWSGDRWRGGDGINLVGGVGGRGNDGGICMLEEDPSILV